MPVFFNCSADTLARFLPLRLITFEDPEPKGLEDIGGGLGGDFTSVTIFLASRNRSLSKVRFAALGPWTVTLVLRLSDPPLCRAATLSGKRFATADLPPSSFFCRAATLSGKRFATADLPPSLFSV